MYIDIYKEGATGSPEHLYRCLIKEKNQKFDTLISCVEETLKTFLEAETIRLPKFRLYTNEEGMSSYHVRKGGDMGYRSRSESVISGITAKEDFVEMSEVIYTKDGEEYVEKFGADLIFDGFVISTGKTEPAGIYGLPVKKYFCKLTTRRIYNSSLCSAKKFATASAALSYVEKNESVFRYMAKNEGWIPRVEYCSDKAKKYMEKEMTARKLQNTNEALDKANALLASLVPEEPIEREYVYGNTQKEEALIRMKELKIIPEVICAFENNDKIMLSEFGGIIYNLNEAAAEAVEKAREKGCLPYHVVCNGTMITVLCVSQSREDWHYERYNPSDGIMEAFVKNGPIEEFGSVVVNPLNGGVMRVG